MTELIIFVGKVESYEKQKKLTDGINYLWKSWSLLLVVIIIEEWMMKSTVKS